MNTKNLNYPNTDSAYPGEYTPVFSDNEELIEELKKYNDGTELTSMNVIEYRDFFLVELATPGIKKEQLSVFIKDDELAVCVLPEKMHTQKVKYHLHQLNFCPFCRVIQVPENIDSYFITSFYEDGLLKIHLPKTTHRFKKRTEKIVVY